MTERKLPKGWRVANGEKSSEKTEEKPPRYPESVREIPDYYFDGLVRSVVGYLDKLPKGVPEYQPAGVADLVKTLRDVGEVNNPSKPEEVVLQRIESVLRISSPDAPSAVVLQPAAHVTVMSSPRDFLGLPPELKEGIKNKFYMKLIEKLRTIGL